MSFDRLEDIVKQLVDEWGESGPFEELCKKLRREMARFSFDLYNPRLYNLRLIIFQQNNPRILDFCSAALSNGDSALGKMAFDTLEHMDDPRAIELIIATLKHNDVWLRGKRPKLFPKSAFIEHLILSLKP
jgi:hypothetical protein